MTRMRNGCSVSPARLVYQRSLSANVTRALEGEAVTKLQNESPTVPLVFGVDKNASFWLQLFSNHCYVCFWARCEMFYCDWKRAPTQICKIFADNKDTEHQAQNIFSQHEIHVDIRQTSVLWWKSQEWFLYEFLSEYISWRLMILTSTNSYGWLCLKK